MSNWQEYEKLVFEKFNEKYPDQKIEYNKRLKGKFSKVERQIDILISVKIADSDQYGVFDCKQFNKRVNVKTIDSMIDFMQDVNANYGGIITCIGFTKAAINRAEASNIKLETIMFDSPEKLVEKFIPSLDFSDPRNSMYYTMFF
ncbi:MAG: restriction endonuclease [Chryseotalea sp.]|jgi:hypothetical protein